MDEYVYFDNLEVKLVNYSPSVPPLPASHHDAPGYDDPGKEHEWDDRIYFYNEQLITNEKIVKGLDKIITDEEIIRKLEEK